MSPTRFGRCLLAFGCLAMLGPAATASPDPLTQFQPKVTGKIRGQDLSSRVQRYFDIYEVHADDPVFLLRDDATYHDWYQTRWAVNLAIDAHQSLRNLEPYGLKPIEGGYEIDLQKFPQWSRPEELLVTLRNPGSFEEVGYDLMERGFRQEDVLKLKQALLAEGDPAAESRLYSTSILEQYTLRLQERKVKQRLDEELAAAHRFQTNRVVHETRRRWALRILDCVDPQPQRILLSYLLERAGTMYIYPSVISEHEQQSYQQEVASGKILEATRKEQEGK